MARLIVDVDVSRLMPAIVRNAEMAGEVETDAMVTVREVLAGKAPGPGQILLVEDGGMQGQWNVTVEGSPPVQFGERYILFLAPDMRMTIPNAEGVLPDRATVPRYYALGPAEGKVKVDWNGHLRIAPGAAQFLMPYNDTDVNSFVALLRARMQVLFPQAPLTRKVLSRPKRPTAASSQNLRAWQSESAGDRLDDLLKTASKISTRV
jgi:hypothetical protein